jgi:uncharacterized membrane protein YkvI
MEKKQSNTSIAIGIACVWMGTHFGPGVASGTQILTYWVKYGVWGTVCSVLAMCLLGYCLYCSMEFSRIYKTYNYGDWIQGVFGMKWVAILFDISFIITMMTALGGSLNAIATLLKNQFGLNYWFGVALVVICAALLCAFGAKIVSLASTYMMYLVIAVLAIIIITCATSGQLHLGQAIANQASTAGITVSLPKALWSGIIYAAFQATVIANISSVANQLPNRSTSKKAAIIGICGNSLMLVALSLFLLSATTLTDYNVLDTATNPLPFYGILSYLGYGWAKLVYVCTVFVAVLSTAVGFCFGGLARFSKFYRKADEKTPGKDAALVAVLLLACALCSKFGIVALVSTGYTILGYVNLPILILPAIFLAGRKIKKSYLKEHNVDPVGVDE